VAQRLAAGGLKRRLPRVGGEVVGLRREASHVAYPVPTILAASIGPTPTIWVRTVPDALTSASMRPSRSAIFLSSVRMSRSTSEASRRRRRVEAPPRARMPRRMRAALSAESDRATPPGRRSRSSPCRRLSARVRSATRSSRLSESRRSTSDEGSGSTAARRSFARRPGRWPGHRARRSCERCR
jgi:hypothetical protein